MTRDDILWKERVVQLFRTKAISAFEESYILVMHPSHYTANLLYTVSIAFFLLLFFLQTLFASISVCTDGWTVVCTDGWTVVCTDVKTLYVQMFGRIDGTSEL